MMRRRRDKIERFCRNLLQGNDRQLHKLITNYRHVPSQIDIQQMQFTKDTFDGSFRNICNELFAHRHVSNGYIIDSTPVLLTPPPPPPTDHNGLPNGPQRTPMDPNGPQRTCYEVIKTIIYLRELTEDDLSKKKKTFSKHFQQFFPFCLIRVNMQ